jgi:hypothetical protein
MLLQLKLNSSHFGAPAVEPALVLRRAGMRDLLLIWIAQGDGGREGAGAIGPLGQSTVKLNGPAGLPTQCARIWTSLHVIDYEGKISLRTEPSSFHWIASSKVETYLTLDS